MSEKQLEGNGAQRLLTLFGVKGAATPVQFALATIVTPMPEISVRIDGDTVDTPTEGIVVAEWLTEHKRTISFNDDVSGNIDGFHGPGTLRDLQIAKKEITIHSDLKEGDRVICGVGNNGQLVYVLDKAVI